MEIIRQEASRLTKLTTDFLDLARLESGRASLAHDPLDMATVIRIALNVLRPEAAQKRIRLVADIPPSLPQVVGDGQRLHQVMLNLVGNAVKYGRPGDMVTISAHAEEGQLRISVADTGPGIPESALSQLFEKFYRVRDAEGWATGTGLGLSVAKQIVETHGGEIGVESRVGVGTTFTFTLPLEEAG